MDVSVVVISVIVLIISIIIDYLLAKEFYSVAKSKGYKDKKYFWYSYMFLFAGYLLIIALPDKNSETDKNIDELPEI